MFKTYHDCTFQGSGSFNWVALLALIVSIASVVFTLSNLYLSKRIEIINIKFNKFCIAALDDLFKTLDSKFNEPFASPNDMKKTATDLFTEIQLYIVALKNVYPKIDIDAITRETEVFTDYVYQGDDHSLDELKRNYNTAKLKVYSHLYEFALKNELSLIKRLGLK